jgi:hypothetical protein
MQDRNICLIPGPQPHLASTQHTTILPGPAFVSNQQARAQRRSC